MAAYIPDVVLQQIMEGTRAALHVDSWKDAALEELNLILGWDLSFWVVVCGRGSGGNYSPMGIGGQGVYCLHCFLVH